MPVGLRRRRNEDTDAAVNAFVEANREAIASAARWGAEGPVTTALYKFGYLSSMYRIEHSADRLLLTIKHHDRGVERAQREFEALSASDGRFAPRAILIDASGRFGSDPIVVTEFLPPRGALHSVAPAVLAQLLADIHANTALRALPIDGPAQATYSLAREFDQEASTIATFAPGTLRDELESMQARLRRLVDACAERFDTERVVYCHGDLPHHHVYRTARGASIVHWEFSRRSHPSRDFGRIACLEAYSDAEFDELLDRYHALVPYRVSRDCIRVQELLESFYGCIHTVFWMDRAPDDVFPRHVDSTLARLRFTNAVLDIRVAQEIGRFAAMA